MSKRMLFILCGLVALVYWIFPVVQFSIFDSLAERTNDHWVFAISSGVYHFFVMFVSGPLPVLIQFALSIGTWFLLYRVSLSLLFRSTGEDLN